MHKCCKIFLQMHITPQNFDLVPKIFLAEKFCSPKILAAEILSDEVFYILLKTNFNQWKTVFLYISVFSTKVSRIGRVFQGRMWWTPKRYFDFWPFSHNIPVNGS